MIAGRVTNSKGACRAPNLGRTPEIEAYPARQVQGEETQKRTITAARTLPESGRSFR
jgi:hypothetical protein